MGLDIWGIFESYWKGCPTFVKFPSNKDAPAFGPDAQLPNDKWKAKSVQKKRKDMSQKITKTICSFYRSIIEHF